MKLRKNKSISCRRYESYEVRALYSGLDFYLNKKEFDCLTRESCYYCGEEPGYKQYMGIVRISDAEGFSLNNCRACCTWCNTMRSNKTEEEFIEKIKVLYKRLIKKR